MITRSGLLKNTKPKIVKISHEAELKFLSRESEVLNWNLIDNCLPIFHALDTEGFFLGLLYDERTGNYQVKASISAVIHETFGIISFYITLPEIRGKGFGIPLFKAAMDHLSVCPTVSLDGVVEYEKMYEKSGFKTFCGTMRKYFIMEQELRQQLKNLVSQDDGSVDIRTITKEDLPLVVKYDKSICGANRSQLLERWLDGLTSTYAKMALNKKGEVVGYGFLKKAAEVGYGITPLFADNDQIANKLLLEMTDKLPDGMQFNLDAIDCNPEVVSWINQFKTKNDLAMSWMWTNGLPLGSNPNKVYGRFSVDIGF